MVHTPQQGLDALVAAETQERITAIPFDERATVTVNGKAMRWKEMQDGDFVFEHGDEGVTVLRPKSFKEVEAGKRYEARGMVGLSGKDDEDFRVNGSMAVSMRYPGTLIVDYPEDVSGRVTRGKRANPFADPENAAAPENLRQNEPYATPAVREHTTNVKRGFREMIRSLLGI